MAYLKKISFALFLFLCTLGISLNGLACPGIGLILNGAAIDIEQVYQQNDDATHPLLLAFDNLTEEQENELEEDSSDEIQDEKSDYFYNTDSNFEYPSLLGSDPVKSYLDRIHRHTQCQKMYILFSRIKVYC